MFCIESLFMFFFFLFFFFVSTDCHLPFISDGLNFEQAINKTSVSESSGKIFKNYTLA